MSERPLLVALLPVLVFGCAVPRGALGDASPDGGDNDSAVDSAVDAPRDASTDASTDTLADIGVDDVGLDARDAMTDTAVDAVPDVVDAGVVDPCGAPVPLVHWDFHGPETLGDRAPAPPIMDLSWTPGSGDYDNGSVLFDGDRLTATLSASRLLGMSLAASNAFSVEGWIRRDSASTTGRTPKRIITCSEDLTHRAFTVGQTGDALVARVQSTNSLNANGDEFRAASFFGTTEARHFVLTWEGTVATLYYDGVFQGMDDHGPAATFVWDTNNICVLGDEVTGERGWDLGRIHEMRIYDVALSPSSITCLEALGPPPTE